MGRSLALGAFDLCDRQHSGPFPIAPGGTGASCPTRLRLLPWHDPQRGASAGSLAQIILDGVPGTPMPPWRPLLSESDALWIANYLLTESEE